MEFEESEVILQNSDPEIVVNSINAVTNIFTYYGWYILVILIALIYAYVTSYPHIERYKKRKADEEYSAKYHKNPDLLQSRMLAMEEARRRMQDKMNEEVEQYKIKAKLKEEQKRQEFIEKYSSDSSGIQLGHGEKSERKDENKKILKQDYNPLMGGSNNGSTYRAPKRSPCGGSGCGK